jgi:hypothetical protein
VAIRDSTYLVDFAQEALPLNQDGPLDSYIGDYIMNHLKKWRNEHVEKIVGLAIPQQLVNASPTLCCRLWLDLDIIPLVLSDDSKLGLGGEEMRYEFQKSIDWELRTLDEQAESMARKCVRYISPPQAVLRY